MSSPVINIFIFFHKLVTVNNQLNLELPLVCKRLRRYSLTRLNRLYPWKIQKMTIETSSDSLNFCKDIKTNSKVMIGVDEAGRGP
jgi:hypothetical protein